MVAEGNIAEDSYTAALEGSEQCVACVARQFFDVLGLMAYWRERG